MILFSKLHISFGDFPILLIGTGIFILLMYTSLISIISGEKTAARRAAKGSFIFPIPFLVLGLLHFPGQEILSIVISGFVVLSGIVFVIPFKMRNPPEDYTPKGNIDERDTMFSRNELISGTEKFMDYYKNNPKNKLLDDKWRELPGLGSPEGSEYKELDFIASETYFEGAANLWNMVEGQVADNKTEQPMETVTNYLKGWAEFMGAHSFGITELKPYHLYSVLGRSDRYNTTPENNYKYAIAITVEMNYDMINQAPGSKTIFESARKYFEVGNIAVIISDYIRKLGYPARAHIDGNYHVVCPLVARDAGLGEIGRMGILMTPHLGPRVRVAVITTDMPLILSKRKYDSTIIDFCNICKKCSVTCPSQAISHEDRENIYDVIRWQIDSEKCYTYMGKTGTDCGKCMAACPYSHRDILFSHKAMNFLIRNSSLFRKIAPTLDDALYGRRPKALKNVSWKIINKRSRK
ncbi:MAG: 4Fe-4S dicluster domain-containing protein [Spirochaetales bacterium]|nr:4Fe-4S dicluster domain-containing protein [Spirochaetales bacterium]